MAPRRVPQAPDPNRQPITGPTSALTSFLREQGITGNIHRRTPATPAAPDPSAGNADASTSAAASSSTSSDPAPVETGKRKKKQATGPAAKKKKAADDNDQGDDFNLAGVKEGAKPGRYDKRIPGSMIKCSECGKRFTVTKYTVSNPLGDGLLCMPCSNESISTLSEAKAKPKAPKKRAVKTLEEKEFKPVRTLQQACIAVIGKQINNVEALGDIGPKNLDRISRIVSKHRALTKDNLDLFLDIGHTELSLYDCTNIDDESFRQIAAFCPHLQRLTLNMVGRLDDSVLGKWVVGLKELKYLSLYAPYLVTVAGWANYFSAFPEGYALEGFGIRQSARFDDNALKLLVSKCPDLYNLQLSEIGKLTDLSLGILHPLKNLTTLDISRSGLPEGTSLTDAGVVALLEAVGENLIELNLDQNYELGDDVLVLGIKPHCAHLRSLSLSHLSLITPEGFSTLFDLWPLNTGLHHVSVRRCTALSSSSLRSLLAHSAHSLQSLNLHSVDEIEQDDLFQLAKDATGVHTLDVSFVRAVDNFVVMAMLEGMDALETLFCHGNNRITDDCPQKRGVSIRGLEGCRHIEL